MDCTPNAFTVTEIGEELFVLTHMTHDIWVKCGDHNTHTVPRSNDPGAQKVEVPCDCAMIMDNETIIPRRFPCISSSKKAGVEHILPAIWTTMTSLRVMIHGPKPRFDNLSECLNANWTMQIPYINLTSADENLQGIERAIQEKEEHRWQTYAHKYASHGDFLFYAWNTLLSICVVAILYRGRLPAAVLAAPNIAHAASGGESWTHEALLGLIATTFLAFGGCIAGRWLWEWIQRRKERSKDDAEKGMSAAPAAKPRSTKTKNTALRKVTFAVSEQELNELQEFHESQQHRHQQGGPLEGRQTQINRLTSSQ